MTSVKWISRGALCALVIPFFSAQAQFQANYGGPAPNNEHGRSVHQLANGPFAGNFIAVGECPQPTNPAQTDVYVVLSNGAGARLNEFSIDIINGNDFGKDFTETASGTIVITGYFFAPNVPSPDIFVLEFDPAAGTISWANDYSGSTPSGNNDDEAYDIEPVADGYVIAGRSNSLHANHTDAILFKIDQGGAWRWGTAYDGASTDEGFFTVASLGNGSLMAGGYTHITGTANMLLAEVNGFGNTQFAMHYGGASNEGIRSVKACSQLGPNANRVIVCGNTGFSSSVLALVDHTNMNWIAGNTYKVPAAGWTEGMSVFETPGPEFKFVMGGLTFDPLGNGSNYQFYLSRVSSMLNIVDWYRIHGGLLSDQGWGVDVATPLGGDAYSVIATGVRSTNMLAQQLDLTRTNQAGVHPCNSQISPAIAPLTFTPVGMPCQSLWGLLLDELSPTVRHVAGPPVFCPPANFSISPVQPGYEPDNSVNGGRHDLLQADTMLLPQIRAASANGGREQMLGTSTFPNPVKRGSTFNLGYTLSSISYVEVSISDVAGRSVYQDLKEGSRGENQMEISTSGWTSGTYVVQIKIGEQTITRRVIVSD